MKTYKVKVSGLTGIQYFEDNNILKVDFELLRGDPSLVEYASRVRIWLPPHVDQKMSIENWNRILSNIKEHFDRKKITYVVDTGEHLGEVHIGGKKYIDGALHDDRCKVRELKF